LPVTENTGTPTEPDRKSADSAAPAETPAAPSAETSADAADSIAADSIAVEDGQDSGSSGADSRHGRAEENEAEAPASSPRRKRHWLRWVALGTSVAVLAVAGTGWWLYRKLDGNITTDTTAADELHAYARERPTPAPAALDAQNILLIGSDSRSGKGNGKYGQDDGGSERSDTTILLHLAADRQSMTAMSIPRDLMVDIPGCRMADGSRTKARFAQFNWAFQFGGAACTIRTVEKLTGIRIDHHIVIDFTGFKDMVNAVDGVEVCLKEPVDDEQAHLKLPAGRQTLDGEQALGFVRARHGIGDGSDTQRMDRQQRFLGALFKKVQSNGVLLNPARLYPVLDAVTKSLTTDAGLGSLSALYGLASSMRSVPAERVQFLTVPRQPYSRNPNRDELITTQAEKLFKQLREDSPVVIAADTAPPDDTSSDDTSSDDSSSPAGSSAPSPASTTSSKPPSMPTTSPTPIFTGSNAEAGMCG
jgi:LCP family protein required for cell wall assembly